MAPQNSTISEPKNEKTDVIDTKYSIPKALGVSKYKETIKRADELFKMKRYQEAKAKYAEALAEKPNDVYSVSKLADIEKLIIKK